MRNSIIAAFKSRSQMIRFDEALKKAGIGTEIISTPKAIALGCGLSIQFDQAGLETAKVLIKALSPTAFEGFYLIQNENNTVKVLKMFN